eukprot:scaffold13290_cov150-Skeletonema_menzelii.AAC.1
MSLLCKSLPPIELHEQALHSNSRLQEEEFFDDDTSFPHLAHEKCGSLVSSSRRGKQSANTAAAAAASIADGLCVVDATIFSSFKQTFYVLFLLPASCLCTYFACVLYLVIRCCLQDCMRQIEI